MAGRLGAGRVTEPPSLLATNIQSGIVPHVSHLNALPTAPMVGSDDFYLYASRVSLPWYVTTDRRCIRMIGTDQAYNFLQQIEAVCKTMLNA